MIAPLKVWANDEARKDFAGSIFASLDGETFAQIPGTTAEFEFPGAARGTFNNIIYTFRPGRVTNFRYLRLNVERPPGKEESRIARVEAFVGRLPDDARYTGVVTRGGSFLAGRSPCRAAGCAHCVHLVCPFADDFDDRCFTYGVAVADLTGRRHAG